MNNIHDFINAQLGSWPMAAKNFAELQGVQSKPCGWARVQFNPARIVSTGAKVDPKALAARPCFLCQANRPAEQFAVDWGEYEILINPFPIFPHHLTIPLKAHAPQSIVGRVADMCRLAKELPGFVVFYNGPRCGASAPDHMHFQAGDACLLPILTQDAPFGIIEIMALTPADAEKEFDAVYQKLPRPSADEEAMMNVLCVYENDAYRLIVIPRRRHRPEFYGTGEGQMLISPASVDLGGLMITPRQQDFEDITPAVLQKVYDQVCYSQAEVDAMLGKAPTIRVGILTAQKLDLNFDGAFLMMVGDSEEPFTGPFSLSARQLPAEIRFKPLSPNAFTEVKDVTIGINFHWERKETQRFAGEITIKPVEDGLLLINTLPVEDYLMSVISSEMSATSQMQLLKAHAVISRSWAMAQLSQKKRQAAADDRCDTPEEVCMWYDHDDHALFDVCADDHCQRYQGITRQTTAAVEQAVRETAGLVLAYDGEIADARFSKCCGGAFEVFESCWEPEHKPYLEAGRDDADPDGLPDLSIEENAREWILSQPAAFCNTNDADVLKQVLNGYDQETADFYRWQVRYSADELAELLRRRSGRDFGRVLDLQPLQRGTSARITRLRIVGEKLTCVVGKELEIRRWLSPSHLYSSAFVAEKTPDGGFILHGAGWGHGVGLCQIGAAMMAAQGYGYIQILNHYYPNAEIVDYSKINH